MRNAIIWSCCLLLVVSLLAGCSGKPQATKTPPPTPPAQVAQPAPPVSSPATAPAANQAATAPAPKQVTLTPTPEVKQSSKVTVATPAPALQTPPAPKLALTTPAEQALGIPIYPGAKAETATPQKNVGDFAQKLVVTTPDSMEQVEIYYTKLFRGAVVMGRGKVGDQPFENILLVSGKGERRAFFYKPSGKREVRIELTVGK